MLNPSRASAMLSVLLLLAGFSHLSGSASLPQQEDEPAIRRRPTLLFANDSDPGFVAAARQIGAERCPIVYEQTFIVSGQVDEAKLRRAVADVVPAGWPGFACLDVENEWFKALAKDPESPEFREGARQLLTILKIAKEVRPEARWAYYGVPSLPFFLKTEEGVNVGWDKASDAVKAPVLEVGRRAQIIVNGSDWVAPTLYDPYLDSAHPEWAEAQKARSREMVKLSLSMGAASGRSKPVFPFVWHRIHSSNKQHGLQLLSNAEFIEGQVRPALEAGASGVVWWGSDRYMLRSGELIRAQPEETASLQGNPAAAGAHVTKVHLEKLEALAPLFR